MLILRESKGSQPGICTSLYAALRGADDSSGSYRGRGTDNAYSCEWAIRDCAKRNTQHWCVVMNNTANFPRHTYRGRPTGRVSGPWRQNTTGRGALFSNGELAVAVILCSNDHDKGVRVPGLVRDTRRFFRQRTTPSLEEREI